MPSNLKKWYRSYENHCWNKAILREEHLEQVKKVERELTVIGKKKLMGLGWQKLHTLVKQLGYKSTTRDRKRMLYCKLCEHMVKRSLWKDPVRNRKQSRKRKLIETEGSVEDASPHSVLRRSKRLRGNQPVCEQQRPQKRRRSKVLPLSVPKRADNLRRAKEKRLAKKHRKSNENI